MFCIIINNFLRKHRSSQSASSQSSEGSGEGESSGFLANRFVLADLVLDIVDVDSSIEQWERQFTADIEGKFKVWTRKLIWSVAFVILQHCDLMTLATLATLTTLTTLTTYNA